jgi:hypothetical protein
VDPRIVVTAAQVRHLAATFEKVWQRPPTAKELQGLVDDHIREEVYVREAKNLGLDRDDTIIRRRLRQKVEFLHEDMFSPPAPDETELERFLSENPQWFSQDAEYTFRHVYFSADRRGATAGTEAEAALAQLRSGDSGVDPGSVGDSFMLGHEFEAATTTFIGRMFGDRFVRELRGLEVGSWAGPVQSGYGLHLVKIASMKEGRLPELSEVRDAVLAEWTHRQRVRANEEFYESLKQRYSISIESPTNAVAAPEAETVRNAQ